MGSFSGERTDLDYSESAYLKKEECEKKPRRRRLEKKTRDREGPEKKGKNTNKKIIIKKELQFGSGLTVN